MQAESPANAPFQCWARELQRAESPITQSLPGLFHTSSWPLREWTGAATPRVTVLQESLARRSYRGWWIARA